MAKSHEFGRRAEVIAADYLVRLGYRILQRNWRVGHKEIDLIVQREGTVAFVEVKGRAGHGYGHPLESITWAKRRELGWAARVWIAAHGRPGLIYRFDAIAVLSVGGRTRVEHIPNAWHL